MKKIWLILFFLFPGAALAQRAPLKIEVKIFEPIEAKYASFFYDIVDYWVAVKTLYQPSVRAKTVLKVTVQQELNRYLLKASLNDGSENPVQGSAFFSSLSDFFEALDEVFYRWIFAGRIVEKPRRFLVPPEVLDLALVIDSTGSMKEETNYWKTHLQNILSPLFWNLKTYRLRMAILDYKNIESDYRLRLENFQEKIGPIASRIQNLESIGKAEGETEYALEYLLKYGHWQSAYHRILLLITDRGPSDETRFTQLAQRAAAMKIRFFILAAEGMPEKDALFYQKTAEKNGGKFSYLTYSATYLLKDMTLKKFLYRNQEVWEDQGEVTSDLTLGRKVRSLKQLPKFLTGEGFAVQEIKELSIDFPEQIREMTEEYKKSIPIGVFETQDRKILRVGIQDTETLQYLSGRRNQPVVLGGHFFPYKKSLSIYPHTVIAKTTLPPRLLLQPLETLLKNPFFFYDKGILEPSVWYIKAVFRRWEED